MGLFFFWGMDGQSKVLRARGCQLINAAGENGSLALSSERPLTHTAMATRTHGLLVFCSANVFSTILTHMLHC